MVTRIWRVYGVDGHRQRETFNRSMVYDFSNNEETRIIRVLNADLTGTHEYSEVIISRDTAKECEEELYGQLCDGIFENSRFGRVAEFS